MSVLATMEPGSVHGGEEDVRRYLQEIRQFPRLTAEEEKELARRCAAGDESAIREMVNANLRLVVSMAREYAGRGVPLMDLVQEGSIGLLVAARKFDPALDYRFSTYATKWIRQGIGKCILNHAGLIRVPQHTAEKIRKLLAVKAKLQAESGIEPDTAQLAAACDLPEKKAAELLSLIPEISSLDAPIGDDEDGTVGMLLEDMTAPEPQEELVRRELKQTIDFLLSGLPERQRQVLSLHFGLENGECCSLEQIGAVLGFSKERARQIEQQAIKSLKTQGAELGLEDFLT